MLQEYFTERDIALVVGRHKELAVGRGSNRSAVAALIDRIGDAKARIADPAFSILAAHFGRRTAEQPLESRR
jgi:hypothetical protein